MALDATFRLLLQGLRRGTARRRAVRELRRSLALFVDLDALEASVAARLKELFDPERLLILQLDRRSSSFRPSFASGVPTAELEGVAIAAGGRLARWLLVNETCLLLPRDRGVLAYLDGAERDLFARLGLRLCAPLLARNHLTGMFLLGAGRPDWTPRKRDAELLQQLADQASLAFQNAALYREQQERLDRLHRADRLAAVGQLAAGVAHEVRNPLTAIRSTMQYLMRSFDPQDAKHAMVGELIGEVDRINATISDLLSLARAGTFERAALDLVALLEQTLGLIEVQARKHGVAIEQRVERRPLIIEADANQIKQLFLNLILNALQAMPGGGRIRVAVAVEEGGDRGPEVARVTIADDGAGIPRQHLDRVFDPFFTTKHEGTGLGLAICHGIVERHGGEIELDSIEGEGTTASIRLPLPA
ncbi:MAG: GAF domain-containing protein [Acidobacteria bacterium]|nr:MAG: GAF domain-containing protein [Acidobacteriota bacterium]